LLLRFVDHALGLGHRLGVHPLGLGVGLLGTLQDRGEVLLGGRRALDQVLLGTLPPLREGLLQVSGCLRGLGALLLEERLGFLAPGHGVVLGRVDDLGRAFPRLGQDLLGLGVGFLALLGGVPLSLFADLG